MTQAILRVLYTDKDKNVLDVRGIQLEAVIRKCLLNKDKVVMRN